MQPKLTPHQEAFVAKVTADDPDMTATVTPSFWPDATHVFVTLVWDDGAHATFRVNANGNAEVV